MQRICLTIEYDGTAYAGWQWQQNALGVQQVVEQAIERTTGSFCRVTGASRTDAGVHARGQAAHFDTDTRIPVEKLPYALNTQLPADVRVLSATAVSQDFHARFGALGKRYTYTLCHRPHAPALDRFRAFHVFGTLDVGAMREAASYLPGLHDFKAFQSTGAQTKTSVRRLWRVAVFPDGERVVLDVSGEGFLYNMVRIIAGTLAYVGMGKRTPDVTQQMILTGQRILGGPTAPPQGLVLEKVYYDQLPDFAIDT